MATERPKRGIPEGLWIRCPACKTTVYKKEVEARQHVCPECDHHFTMPARDRIAQLLDEDSFEEWDTDLRPCDPLGFVDRIPYHQRLAEEQKKTGMNDAAVTGDGLHPRAAGGARHHRLRVHGRQHGERGRREADPRRGEGDRAETAAHLRQRVRRRCADAGRHPVADADGEDVRRAGPLRLGRRAVRVHPDQPDDGRGGRELGAARRHHAGRTAGDDRVRRPPRHHATRCGWNCRTTSRRASSCSSTGSWIGSFTAKTSAPRSPASSTTARSGKTVRSEE